MKTSQTDADLGAWIFLPNALGEVNYIRDAKTNAPGWTTVIGYDALSRMTSRQDVAEGVTSNWVWGTSAAAHNVGRLASLSGSGYAESLSYDSLMVEDDDAVRTLAETILAGYGHTVLVAPDGSMALELATSAGSISLLVADVMMPGIRGPELAERLLTSHPGLRVLFISGYAAEAVGNHDLLERGAAYLEKPFTPEFLALAVRAALDAPELVTER